MNYNIQLGQLAYFYLQPYLLIHSGWSVAKGDGVTEAGLPLDGPLGYVHDDLRALGAGVEEQRVGGQTSTRLDGKAALGLVVASLRCGRKWSVQRIYVKKEKLLLNLVHGWGEENALLNFFLGQSTVIGLEY